MKEHRDALSKYRMEKASKCLRIAKICIQNEDYESAANRSYYAMFHSVRALLAIEGMDYSKHSAVIGHFRREYVKTGKFDQIFSDYIGNAFDIRGKSDYDDYYIISKGEVVEQEENAIKFYNAVRAYLKDTYALIV